MDDYISREDAVEWFMSFIMMDEDNIPADTVVGDLKTAIPAADVEPVRHGRWEECDWVDVDEHGFGTRRTFKAGLRCSQCACVFKKELLWKRNWCPNCGAKMEGGADG